MTSADRLSVRGQAEEEPVEARRRPPRRAAPRSERAPWSFAQLCTDQAIGLSSLQLRLRLPRLADVAILLLLELI